jgi:uncharacterized protein
MLRNELPAQINPEKLCRLAPPEGTRLSGQMPLKSLGNLSGDLKGQQDAIISVSLEFSIDKEGYCCIKGEMTVDLNFTCQRCMQPMIQTVKSSILVSPVTSDAQAKQLPARYEPLLVTDGEVSLKEWIAEELHLALPLVPRHETPCLKGNGNGDEKGMEGP